MKKIDERIAAATEKGEILLSALSDKIAALGLAAPVIPRFDTARFTLEEDRYDGSQTLLASFYTSEHHRAGVVLFHSDGSSYAEYHVLQRHPSRGQWFIESVQAWFHGEEIKCDLRLSPVSGC